MGVVKEHIAKSDKNLEFLEFLRASTEKYSDWQITAIFYAGVHRLDAYLHNTYNTNDNEIDSHKKVLKYLENKSLWDHHKMYLSLFSASCAARYSCLDMSRRIPAAEHDFKRFKQLCTPTTK